MNPVEFQSSNASIVISWILFAIWVVGTVRILIAWFTKQPEIPLAGTIWSSLCIFVLSPVRYIWFQFLLFHVYCFQSISAFWSIVFIDLILFGVMLRVMGLIAFSFPIAVKVFLFRGHERVSLKRGLLAAVLIPASCVLSTVLYFYLLPFAALTFHWLNYKDLMKATNGSPAFVFKYFYSPVSYTHYTDYFQKTPKSDIDWLRCNVATLYLTEQNQELFMKTQYPNLYRDQFSFPAVSSFALSSTSVKRGDKPLGTVKIAKASSVDVVVNLSSSNAAIASFPASITIPKGQLLATFQVTTTKPTITTSVSLSATTGGLAKSVVLKVNP